MPKHIRRKTRLKERNIKPLELPFRGFVHGVVFFFILAACVPTTAASGSVVEGQVESETCFRAEGSVSCSTDDNMGKAGVALAGPRRVAKVVLSVEQGEGVGARVRRSIGTAALRHLQPFLMLDEFKVTPPAGFPDHPHRGFETVTYMLDGTPFVHEDFNGHKGTIHPGDLQWMTAGRGIVHSEMPDPTDTSGRPAHGLQLWINLKKKDKMVAPAYQELPASAVPIAEAEGVQVKVIAGTALGTTSKVLTRTPVEFLDFKLMQGARHQQPVPSHWTCFAYILQGQASFADAKAAGAHNTVVLEGGEGRDHVAVENKGSEPLHFVLLSGEPIDEPVAQRGPFVMNTEAELRQAMEDYWQGRNGFENKDWNSSLGKNAFQ